jgi:hypothetical protein
MRPPHGQILGLGCFKEFKFAADSISQDPVDQPSVAAVCRLDGFVNGRVLRRLKEEELIESKSQQIAGSVIEMTRAELGDPEVEQGQVTNDAIKKLGGEGPIRRIEPAGSQPFAQNGVRKFFSRPPFFKRGESKMP